MLEQNRPYPPLSVQNMIRMRTELMCTLLCIFSLPIQAGEDDRWHTDFLAAQQIATKEDKDLLIQFTASDWCGWCIKLNKEVFDKAAFTDEITQDFVLVKVEFPRRKKLSPEVSQQNAALKTKYTVATYPTVILCDSQGRPYARTQYKEGGENAYLDHLAKLQLNKKSRDAAFKAAEGLQGAEKARMLEKALSYVPRTALTLHKEAIENIHSSDPDDMSGFYNGYLIQKTAAELRQVMTPLLAKGNHEDLIVEVDSYIRKNKLVGEPLQTALLFKLGTYLMAKNHEEALKCAEEVITINDINKRGRYASMVKKRILRQQEQK